MPEPQSTPRAPHEHGLGLPNTIESLGVDPEGHTLDLTFGGSLSLTAHDGNYRIRFDADGGHFSYPLSILDVYALDLVTGRVIKDRITEILETVE
jgi:hypothetical protein